ncbi:uncharacterized protein LOC110209242 [Phascolarctos cinereus]
MALWTFSLVWSLIPLLSHAFLWSLPNAMLALAMCMSTSSSMYIPGKYTAKHGSKHTALHHSIGDWESKRAPSIIQNPCKHAMMELTYNTDELLQRWTMQASLSNLNLLLSYNLEDLVSFCISSGRSAL